MNVAIRAILGHELALARRTHGLVSAQTLDSLASFSDAYLLQESVRNELGARVVGWKLAAPSSGVISAPLLDMACVAADSVHSDTAVLREAVPTTSEEQNHVGR